MLQAAVSSHKTCAKTSLHFTLCCCRQIVAHKLQEGLLTPTAQRSACETWNAHSFLLRVGAFRPEFYGNRVICQNVDTVRGSWSRYNFPAGSFSTMKLCGRLLMFFCRHLCEKCLMWVSEPHFGEVRGDARPWLIARWKARGRLSIRYNWTFFAIYYGCGVIRLNGTARLLSQGGRLLCTQILPG